MFVISPLWVQLLKALSTVPIWAFWVIAYDLNCLFAFIFWPAAINGTSFNGIDFDVNKYRIASFILFDKGFVRISKWNVVNVNMIRSAFRLFNSRIKIKLTTGEELYVNRGYIKSFNKYLMGKGVING